MRRALWILLTPTVGFLVLWALIDLAALPAVGRWLKEQAEAYGREETSPVAIHIDSIELHILRPSALVRGIQLTPRGDLAKIMGPVTVRSLSARLDLFEAVLGRLHIGGAVVEGLSGSLEIDPLLEDKGDPKPLPLDQIFSWAGKIPMHRLTVDDTQLSLLSRKMGGDVDVRVSRAVALNLGTKLHLQASLPSIHIHRGWDAELSLALAVGLTPKELALEGLRVRAGDIVVRAKGTAADPANLPIKPRLDLSASTEFPLDRLGELIAKVSPQTKLPPMAGSFAAETEIRLEGTSSFDSALRMKTTGVKIGQFNVGDARVEGRLTEQALRIDRIELKHPAGDAQLTETRLAFRPPYSFDTTIEARALDLQNLFQSLGLHQIPVWIGLKGKLPCHGEFQPFAVKCTGAIEGDRLLVKSGMKERDKAIVSLKDLGAEGEVSVDGQGVTFKTAVRLGSSHGESEGTVGFEDGFKIRFKTAELAFKDVDDLAGLSFVGGASIEGSTEGNSETASFDLKMHAHDFAFEKYAFGELGGILKFRRGHLLFEDLMQSMGRTRVNGSMDLDLGKNAIAGEFSAESVDAADLVEVFADHWRFPLDIQAGGRASMQFDGPLDFWKMSYRLDADFKNGRLQGDAFDSLKLKATSKSGDLRIEAAELRKGPSFVKAAGGIGSDQAMDIAVEATDFRLEDSEFVARIRNGVAGRLNLTTKIQGHVAEPDVRIKGSLSDLSVDEQDIPGSFFDLHLDRRAFGGEANLFGNRIQGDLQIPFEPGQGPLRIRLKTNDWPFTSLLSLIGASSLQNEYESSLTSDVDLHSDAGRFDQMSGKISVRSLRMQRGTSSLRNNGPIEATLTDGRISLKNAVLEGPGGALLRARGDDFRLDRLAVGLQADTDLRLLHLLLPFLEDVGGRLKVEASLSGSMKRPEILGNASLQNAFFRLKGFPHPIEKLQAEVVFSQTRVLVQGLKAQLGGGTVDGEGTVQINGIGDIPVNLRLHAQGLNLNVPDKVRSSGDADLVFSGKWFPFVLSGTYNVSSALVEKEFGGDATAANLRASTYLPKILRQAQFDPVILDLQVVLNKNVAVRNSQMDGAVTGQLQVKGPPQNPILLGKISTEKGAKIIVKDKTFELVTGNVDFNNPNEINPDLYLSAQARVNEYDVTVLVQGPAKNPTIRMSSVPPLAESDIVSLLALGITSSQLETQKSSQEQQLGYEAIGIGLAKTGTSKAFEKTFGLNVQITSSFDQTKNISIPKLTFTRKLNDRVNATYTRPINGDSTAYELKLQYLINSNVSAIGSYEERGETQGVLNTPSALKSNIFGLDLEFKREFK